MNSSILALPHLHKQKGALLVLTLLILLVVSVLGMASIDSTGLEMKMSSNSRAQQQAFEAAEYTLSWVESEIAANGYFLPASYRGETGCGNVCFGLACTNGYCFSGDHVGDIGACNVIQESVTAEPYELASTWADGSGKHKTFDVPNVGITAKYIIEFWCYAPANPEVPKDNTNFKALYRITAYAVAEDGKARAMLRTVVKES